MIKIAPIIVNEQLLKKAAQAAKKWAGNKTLKIFDKAKNAWFRTAKGGAKKTDEERVQEWDQIKNKINAFFTEFQIKPDPAEFEQWVNKNVYGLTLQNVTKLLAQKYLGGVGQINLSKEILKNLGDEFQFFAELGADQYNQIMKRALGVAKGSEQKLREYFGKLVEQNLDSLLGEVDEDASQVAKKAANAIGIEGNLHRIDFGKRVGNTEMIAQMMTEYDQLFSKLPKVEKEKFITSIQNIDVSQAAKALLQLLVKNIKHIDKDKTKGKDPISYNAKLLNKILGIPIDEIENVLKQALNAIDVNTLPAGLTKEEEIHDEIVNTLLNYEKEWKPLKTQIEQIVSDLMEKYDVDNFDDDDKKDLIAKAMANIGAIEKKK